MRLFRSVRSIGGLVKNRFNKEFPGLIDCAVILDNRFPDFFSQISFLFSSGFLDPATTIVIAKEHRQSRNCLITASQKYAFKLCFFSALSEIPSLPVGTVVFYPYNAQANFRVLQERHCIHVFIGHGDSNKAASIHPLLRAYDHVLLCGMLSRQRLFSSGIFHEDTIELGRTIMLGDSVIGSEEDSDFRLSSDDKATSVAWLPTWEGGMETVNYSSVAESLTFRFISALCDRLNLDCVWIDVHPNLGVRLPAYGKHLSDIIERLVACGLHIQMPLRTEQSHIVQFLKKPIRRGVVEIASSPSTVKHAIVDVSAMESLMAARGIPSTVLWRDSAPIHASRLWWELRKKQVVSLGVPESLDRVLEQFDSLDAENRQYAFQSACCNYEDDILKGMTHKQRFKWLFENLHRYNVERAMRLQSLSCGAFSG